MLVLR